MRGPNIDPCGTPYVTRSNVDWKLFVVTNCYLFCKYECNSLLATPFVNANFLISIS